MERHIILYGELKDKKYCLNDMLFCCDKNKIIDSHMKQEINARINNELRIKVCY